MNGRIWWGMDDGMVQAVAVRRQVIEGYARAIAPIAPIRQMEIVCWM
ncbi:MAG: hypothetical protein JXR76_07030 [Deltaproteobacteria bacterium]|nr:hypothetical protein [Deltaproteobacteria bacterium]